MFNWASIFTEMPVLDEIGATLGRQLSLPYLPGHLQTIAYSFGVFTMIYIVSALTSPFIAPGTYPKLPRRTKHSWNVHAVSMAHAIVIGPMAAHRLLTLPEVGSSEKAFGWNESMGLLHGIAVGFVWDTIESVLAQVEIGFIIHGLACTLIFGLSYRPFMAFYGPSALVWEISTPFLNSKIQRSFLGRKLSHIFPRLCFSSLVCLLLNKQAKCCDHSYWIRYLDKLQMTGGPLQAINGFILLGLFFTVRVCYGLYMSFDFFQTLLAVHGSIPIGLTLTYGLGNIALNVLNLFWFTKMIAALRKRFQKGDPGANLPNGNTRATKKFRSE
ncbi:unnamed protein product [Rhizoctonia solani]|uniref:TLC domain-containing protein n=1 Tax=Rhizoctonia solani TaxID=456999 RepID=A0A8H3AIU9_9AGAM|nr:unnamed protein product [Rhizoctonia solani]